MEINVKGDKIKSIMYKDADVWYADIYVNSDRILPGAEFESGWGLCTLLLYESLYWKRYAPKTRFFNLVDAEKQ